MKIQTVEELSKYAIFKRLKTRRVNQNTNGLETISEYLEKRYKITGSSCWVVPISNPKSEKLSAVKSLVPLKHFDFAEHKLNREKLISINLAIIHNFLSKRDGKFVSDYKDANEVRVVKQTLQGYHDPEILTFNEIADRIDSLGSECSFHEVVRDDELHKIYFDIEQVGDQI